MTNLTFQTVINLQDEFLVDWLNLYETSFPPEERLLVSTFIQLLQKKEQGDQSLPDMLAAVDAERNLVGMAMYASHPETSASVLWYLATHSTQRGLGYGSKIYQEIVRRSRALDYQVMVFEIEIPEKTHSPEQKKLADRRIQFYHRNGAKLLTGIHYLQSVGAHQPLTPMHLMFHPLKKINSQDAFTIAQNLFGEAVTKVGEFALEG